MAMNQAPVWSLRFHALTIVVEVISDSEAVVPGLMAILGSYPASNAAPDLTYSMGQNPSEDSEAAALEATHKLLRNGDVMDEAASLLDVPSILERDLFQQCIAHATDCVVLHAAAVVIGGDALVMVGPSGSGKSTLTRALLAEGAEYLSDECVAIHPDGKVTGLARPIYLEAREGEGALQPIGSLHQHQWDDESGRLVHDTLLHPACVAAPNHAPLLGRLVLISYVPGSEGTRAPVAAARALTRLWPCVFNPTARTLETLSALLSTHSVAAVASASVPAGIALVRAGLKEPGSVE